MPDTKQPKPVMPIESVLSGHSRELPPVGYWTSTGARHTSVTRMVLPREETVPLSWFVDQNAPFVRVRYTDPYSFDDWRGVFERLRAESTFAFRRQIGVFSDRTEVGPVLPLFAQTVAAYVATHASILRDRRIAFVVRDAESALSVWRLATAYEEAGAICTVFQSPTEAERWLRPG